MRCLIRYAQTCAKGRINMTYSKKATYTTGLFVAFFCFYFTLQHAINVGNINLILEIDKSIPFMPEFVWIYHSIFFQVFLVMVCFIKDKDLFFRTFWSCVVCSVILFLFYMILPSFTREERLTQLVFLLSWQN